MNEEIIQFAVTPEEKKLIEEMAKIDDRTVSDYAHRVVVSKAKYDKETLEMFAPPAIVRKALRELKKL
jgi:uncharacterized protein (DUF1778 family)